MQQSIIYKRLLTDMMRHTKALNLPNKRDKYMN